MNNLNIPRKKTSFTRFKVKQRNLFGLVLINTGNLVHSAIISDNFWEAIGGKISNSMDYKVGTADGQNEGLWPIYGEGMEECIILEPQVIRGLSHSMNLGISFLTRSNLKLICTEDKVAPNACKRVVNLKSKVRRWRMQ